MAFKDEDIAAEFDRRTAPFRDMNVMRCLKVTVSFRRVDAMVSVMRKTSSAR